MRATSLIALVLLSVVVPSYADEAALINSYVPFKKGAAWDYRAGENRFTIRVPTDEKKAFEKVGDLICARLELVVNNKVVAFEHIGKKDNMLLRTTFEGKTARPPIPFLSVPFADGKTWKVESKIDAQVLKGAFKASITKKVTVPAGSYDNVATVTGVGLEVNGVKLGLEYYFAEKVGMIKQVIKVEKEPDIVVELERFTPGK